MLNIFLGACPLMFAFQGVTRSFHSFRWFYPVEKGPWDFVNMEAIPTRTLFAVLNISPYEIKGYLWIRLPLRSLTINPHLREFPDCRGDSITHRHIQIDTLTHIHTYTIHTRPCMQTDAETCAHRDKQFHSLKLFVMQFV